MRGVLNSYLNSAHHSRFTGVADGIAVRSCVFAAKAYPIRHGRRFPSCSRQKLPYGSVPRFPLADLMHTRPVVVSAILIALSAISIRASEKDVRPWNHEIVYSVLIDRFFDGDPSNNVPEGSDPALHDKTQQDVNKYHGGDLRGLETAIQRSYFKNLGVTTLAVSPPVKNVWFSQGEGESAKTGYAGDWAQDFLDIDPHWTSAKSVDGKTDYPDSREGRMQHYKDFVASAHSNGLRHSRMAVVMRTPFGATCRNGMRSRRRPLNRSQSSGGS